MKNISFLSENFQFLEVKFSIYLNRRVFVMVVRIGHKLLWCLASYALLGDRHSLLLVLRSAKYRLKHAQKVYLQKQAVL